MIADLPFATRRGLRRHRRGHDAAVRLAVRGAAAGRRRDDRGRLRVAVRRLAKPPDARIDRARGLFDSQRDGTPLSQRPVDHAGLVDVQIGVVDRFLRKGEIGVGLGDARHPAGRVGAGSDAVRAEVARVGEAEALLVEDADADAALAARDGAFDRALLDLHGSRLRLAEEDLPGRDA